MANNQCEKKNTLLGVNFTNILHAAFRLVDLENVKKIDNLTVFFTLLGSACVKAVRRTFMKFSLGVNIISILHAAFRLVDLEFVKKIANLTVFFYAIGICMCKSCT